MPTHVSFTIFLIVLAGIMVFCGWVYLNRRQFQALNFKKLLKKPSFRFRPIGPPVIKIRLQEGVFMPDKVHLKVNCEYKLVFTRRDKSPSATRILLPYFHRELMLEMGKPEQTLIKFKEVGQYPFQCYKGLFRGWFIVTH